MYSGGNTSLLVISGLSQDSVPITKSGSVTDKMSGIPVSYLLLNCSLL